MKINTNDLNNIPHILYFYLTSIETKNKRATSLMTNILHSDGLPTYLSVKPSFSSI